MSEKFRILYQHGVWYLVYERSYIGYKYWKDALQGFEWNLRVMRTRRRVLELKGG
jgi:hypothetical protein